MTTSTQVDRYLGELRSTAADRLGRQRADELVGEIGEHIDAAIASGQAPAEVLDRLGSPAEIVTAEAPTNMPTPGPRLRVRELLAIILLLLGIVVFAVGWVVGLVLLLWSDRWSTRDKLIGALVWPGGLGPFLAVGLIPASVTTETCDSSGSCSVVSTSGSTLPPWAGILLAIALVVPPIWTSIHLAGSARLPRS